MDELSTLILRALKNQPNQKAKEIANSIGKDKKTVNHYLYFELKKKVVQNEDYSWLLIEDNNGEPLPMDSSTSTKLNDNFAFDSLQSIRNRLLDLTGRNRLLNFKHIRLHPPFCTF